MVLKITTNNVKFPCRLLGMVSCINIRPNDIIAQKKRKLVIIVYLKPRGRLLLQYSSRHFVSGDDNSVESYAFWIIDD